MIALFAFLGGIYRFRVHRLMVDERLNDISNWGGGEFFSYILEDSGMDDLFFKSDAVWPACHV